jgi:hypothetical protein
MDGMYLKKSIKGFHLTFLFQATVAVLQRSPSSPNNNFVPGEIEDFFPQPQNLILRNSKLVSQTMDGAVRHEKEYS